MKRHFICTIVLVGTLLGANTCGAREFQASILTSQNTGVAATWGTFLTCRTSTIWRHWHVGNVPHIRGVTMQSEFHVSLMGVLSSARSVAEIPGKQAVPAVIFDTDIGSDCDDAGALAVLHALADAGELRVLGVIFSSGKNRYGVGTCDAINTYYGRGDLPLGQYQGADVGDPRNSYTKQIAMDTKRFGHDTVDKAPELVATYRSLLESQPDQSVTICTVGHPHGLVHLLRDPRGAELVRTKVDRWVAMGTGGWNFQQMGMSAYCRELLEKWSLPFYISPNGCSSPIGLGRPIRFIRPTT